MTSARPTATASCSTRLEAPDAGPARRYALAGQRRRLALALVAADPPHVPLLDEPTNQLSLALIEELEDALHTAPCAIVAASHDRWLRRR